MPPNLMVVPAFNEEENLPRLLAELETRPELFPGGSVLFVVDDGSADSTPLIVSSYDGPLPVELVRLERNQGPGAAFRAGFDAALSRARSDEAEGALVVTLEADTTSDLDAVPRMIERARGDADVVLASWVMVNVPLARRLLSAGAGAFVRSLLGVDAKTVSSFLRVYRVGALERAVARHGDDLIRESGFACKAELLAKLAALGVCIEEVPVDLDTSQRVGKSKMPIARTFVAYWRMAFRQWRARGTAPA
ncbi:MAG TPA: glycosyltransferase family 2 protein [Gaiellaceae bacterium]|nr:glycosyltransferase family 2 protein [Gaiellaceae bacterium]